MRKLLTIVLYAIGCIYMIVGICLWNLTLIKITLIGLLICETIRAITTIELIIQKENIRKLKEKINEEKHT